MRSYPRNSPEAAARIVALVLIADGHVCRSEFDVFDRLGGARALGLDAGGLPRIVQTLCEDLLMGGHDGGLLRAGIDDVALASLMAEIDEPALQRQVLGLAAAAARADRHLADGEAFVLAAARRHWKLGEDVEGALEAAPAAA